MSNERAIAAVTATLRNLVFRALSSDPDLAGTEVTARPPDRARNGGAAGNQLNLFLYRTSIDPAWRNQDPPGARAGETGRPALPLVLSYLLTAYGENDDELLSHQLLGVGMRVLHERPLLAPHDIAAALPGTGLDTQVERVRITPHPLPMDEISRLWATFQTGYRISVGYDAAVVLIDDTTPPRAPTPVLARNAGDAGPFVGAGLPPVLTAVSPPAGRPAALPGDQLVLIGQRLGAVTSAVVSGLRVDSPLSLPTTAQPGGALSVQLPEGDALPAGTVVLTLEQADLAGAPPVTSNPVPVPLAPTLTNTVPLAATLIDGAASLTITCAPPVRAGQSVALVVGDRLAAGVPGAPGDPPRAQLTFALEGFVAGSYLLRLRVDGVDSVPVADGEHAFSDHQRLVLS